jgi:hypothetical protein
LILDTKNLKNKTMEQELTEKSLRLCLDVLVKLPFTMTDENTEPNMITVIHKEDDSHPEFQIWRETDEEFSFMHSSKGRIDPKTFSLNGTKYISSNDYLIELTCGEHFVNPVNYSEIVSMCK